MLVTALTFLACLTFSVILSLCYYFWTAGRVLVFLVEVRLYCWKVLWFGQERPLIRHAWLIAGPILVPGHWLHIVFRGHVLQDLEGSSPHDQVQVRKQSMLCVVLLCFAVNVVGGDSFLMVKYETLRSNHFRNGFLWFKWIYWRPGRTIKTGQGFEVCGTFQGREYALLNSLHRVEAAPFYKMPEKGNRTIHLK